ncbi:Pyridine nucleotide-disulfide oxidoreductase domain-containing protein 1 [Chamberlinius hualienensis]
MEKKSDLEAVLAVIGGGIAGVTCAEQLAALNPTERVMLFSASPLVKVATNVRKIAKVLEVFEVEERPVNDLTSSYSNLEVVSASVEKVDSEKHMIYTAKKEKPFRFKKLCICTGGIPKVISEKNPHVIGIRDTETVKEFEKRISEARRIVIVGNGGIATELAYEIRGCQVIWAVKDRSIGATFFDAGAAEFFLPHLTKTEFDETESERLVKRTRYYVDGDGAFSKSTSNVGSALGPDWALGRHMKGSSQILRDVHVEYCCEVANILTPEEFKLSKASKEEDLKISSQSDSDSLSWPVYIELTNGKIYGCDFVVSATGVIPNVSNLALKVDLAEDGGIIVNEHMQSSEPDIYAAGDACTAGWKKAEHWFQMRLWTQARHTGAYAAHCISLHLSGEEVIMDFCFELFTHVTKFFGYKTVLLGLYNGQSLGSDYELLLRMTKGVEYIKVVMRNGRMQGAVLIGDTDLEETFENLILNQFDLTNIQDDLLNPDIDIEDYFD